MAITVLLGPTCIPIDKSKPCVPRAIFEKSDFVHEQQILGRTGEFSLSANGNFS